MKTKILLSAFCLLTTVFTSSAYIKTIEEDKIWEYKHGDGGGGSYSIEYYKFDGSTIEFNGNVYSPFVRFKSEVYDKDGNYISTNDNIYTSCFLREEDGKVFELFYKLSESYEVLDDSDKIENPDLIAEFVIYDWNLPEGYDWNYYTQMNGFETWRVNYSEPVMLNDGSEAKVMVLGYTNGEFPPQIVKFIEGLGVDNNGYLGNVSFAFVTGFAYIRLKSVCRTDGEVIYTTSDSNAINEIKSETDNQHNRMFDIFGCEILQPARGQIYIQNGKKIIGD